MCEAPVRSPAGLGMSDLVCVFTRIYMGFAIQI